MEKKRIKVTEAARIMGVSDEFVRVGLIKGLLPFGVAMKKEDNKRYSYYISPKLFAEYVGEGKHKNGGI